MRLPSQVFVHRSIQSLTAPHKVAVTDHHPHLTDEETGPERSGRLPKFTQLTGGQAATPTRLSGSTVCHPAGGGPAYLWRLVEAWQVEHERINGERRLQEPAVHGVAVVERTHSPEQRLRPARPGSCRGTASHGKLGRAGKHLSFARHDLPLVWAKVGEGGRLRVYGAGRKRQRGQVSRTAQGKDRGWAPDSA